MQKKINRIVSTLPNEVCVDEAVFKDGIRSNLKECLNIENIRFEGDIISIDPERVLIRNLYFEYEKDGKKTRAKETHAYVYSGIAFLSFNERDIVSFESTPYIYRRKDGTYDIGLKNAKNISRIDVRPTVKEATSASKAVCGMCRYKKICDGICLIPERKKSRITRNVWKGRMKKWLKEYSFNIAMGG